MRILAVIGSPKGKGSGYRVVRMIEDRMKVMGEVEFACLFLRDANLKPCTGCYACMARGEDKCPLKDDRAAIERELLAADGVILSSPMCVLNVSWLMKNFIDRFAYANHRPCFHRQKVLTVINMGGDSPGAALSFLRHALGGSRIVHELGIATPPWPQTKRAIEKKERALDVAARKFYRACLQTSLPSPTLYDLILFYVRQKAYIRCPQSLPTDNVYYSGKAYYYETKISPIKAATARAVAGIMLSLAKDTSPGDIPWPATKEKELRV